MQERSAATRQKLLDATIFCVSEFGYTKATMDKIVHQAGTSRGAQMHHFATKSLLARAALRSMFDGLIDVLRSELDDFRAHGSGAPSQVFRRLWHTYFSQREYQFTLELIVASRSDPLLRQELLPLTAEFRAEVDMAFSVLVEGKATPERLTDLSNLGMTVLRGLGVQVPVFENRQYLDRLLDVWLEMLDLALERT